MRRRLDGLPAGWSRPGQAPARRERETHIFPAQGLQGPEWSVEQAAPLQLMPKKRKKQGAAPGININTATSDDRTTPLGIAVYSGYEDVVGVLLDAPNIDIDVRKHSGTTPLYLATQENFPRIVEQLVKRGADVNLAMNDGSTPLCAAADRGHVEIVRTLLRAPAIEINLAIKEGATALTFASQEGYKEIIRLLLRKGADPNLAHNSGMIPLHFACLHGHTAVVEMLLHAGPDTDIKAVEGMAPDKLIPTMHFQRWQSPGLTRSSR